jgi:hypothetical protein
MITPVFVGQLRIEQNMSGLAHGPQGTAKCRGGSGGIAVGLAMGQDHITVMTVQPCGSLSLRQILHHPVPPHPES